MSDKDTNNAFAIIERIKLCSGGERAGCVDVKIKEKTRTCITITPQCPGPLCGSYHSEDPYLFLNEEDCSECASPSSVV